MTLKNELPLKYKLEMHSVLDEYPTPQDVLYDLIRFCSKNKIKTLTVTKEHLVQMYTSRLQNQVFMNRVKTGLKDLIDSQFITKQDSDNLVITKLGIASMYDK